MKITKPTITQAALSPGLWYCRVALPPGVMQFHGASGNSMMEAYRAWVDAASREPWHYGVGGLDMEYHREQIQQMEANAAFKGVERAELFMDEEDEGIEYHSDYLDQRTQVLTGLATGEETSLLAFVKDRLGLKPEPWQERMMVALECGGCAPPILVDAPTFDGHLAHEIASMQGQGLLRPSPPIPENYLANFGPNCS